MRSTCTNSIETDLTTCSGPCASECLASVNVEAKSTEDGRLVLRFRDGGFEDPFIARYVSDGTIKMFAYLILLNDPKPHPLLAVEEPENQLYPDLLRELSEEFHLYARNGRQVLRFRRIRRIFSMAWSLTKCTGWSRAKGSPLPTRRASLNCCAIWSSMGIRWAHCGSKVCWGGARHYETSCPTCPSSSKVPNRRPCDDAGRWRGRHSNTEPRWSGRGTKVQMIQSTGANSTRDLQPLEWISVAGVKSIESVQKLKMERINVVIRSQRFRQVQSDQRVFFSRGYTRR